MNWLAERMLSLVRPVKPRPIKSTRNELTLAMIEHRKIGRRTTKLALLLDDYRRSDRVLRR